MVDIVSGVVDIVSGRVVDIVSGRVVDIVSGGHCEW